MSVEDTERPPSDSTLHDLRTPLTSIIGFAELLMENETIIGQSREYLEIILDESRKLDQMITGHFNDQHPQ